MPKSILKFKRSYRARNVPFISCSLRWCWSHCRRSRRLSIITGSHFLRSRWYSITGHFVAGFHLIAIATWSLVPAAADVVNCKGFVFGAAETPETSGAARNGEGTEACGAVAGGPDKNRDENTFSRLLYLFNLIIFIFIYIYLFYFIFIFIYLYFRNDHLPMT